MKRIDIIHQKRLFCPGPTPVPAMVRQASMGDPVYHRSEDFGRAFNHCRGQLAKLMRTREIPIILSSSGTGAMEAAVVNLTEAGDNVGVIVGGKFGERWQKIAERYECNVHALQIPWGEAPTADHVVKLLSDHPQISSLFLQANETSTGVGFPLKELVSAAKALKPDILVAVDAVSGLCAQEIAMDDWGIDCLVSGSQKGFGVPPGLSFIALSQRAKAKLGGRPCFYFDLKQEFKAQSAGASAWTPATSLISQLEIALNYLCDQGVEALVAHHRKLAKAARDAMAALGLKLFAKSHHSNALTAIVVPPGQSGSDLLKVLQQEYGCTFAGGQDHLKGKIIRLSHLGFVDRFDLLSGISALEFALHQSGYLAELGSGLSAAMRTLADRSG